jgi:hypothetical protein
VQTPGSVILHEQKPSPSFSREVDLVVGYLAVNGEAILNQPANKIAEYLGFLADPEYVNDGLLTGDADSIERQIESHVIASGDVPENFFALQRRKNLEEGRGDDAITAWERKRLIKAAQTVQRAGLKQWADHLEAKELAYPDWFKYLAFAEITKFVDDPHRQGEFMKRSHGTTAPCPELNRDAVAYVYRALNKSRVLHEPFNGGFHNGQLQKLLQSKDHFNKLYAVALSEVIPLAAEVEGSWITFEQSPDPADGQRMAQALQGQAIRWCNANPDTASRHLLGGDFYAFFSRDKHGEDSVLRIGVRMAEGVVAEVRGVGKDQELEVDMAATAAKRLHDLAGGEAYVHRAEDMTRLTAIDKKLTFNPDAKLTDKELRFLYEMDEDIEGFGNDLGDELRDPRINDIRAQRQGQDSLEIVRLMPETVHDQLKGAFAAYKTVANRLSIESVGAESGQASNEFEYLFERKDKEWRENGVYDYLTEKLIANGTRYNLVATPNVAATEQQIVDLAESVGARQKLAAFVHAGLYCQGQFSGQELSGNVDEDIVRFSLIPDRSDAILGSKSAALQGYLLQALQVANPRLRLHVPTVLDAIANWYVLSERGHDLSDSKARGKTYIRHFDLAKTLDNWSVVPITYIGDGGKPHLSSSNAAAVDDARLGLG